MMMMTERAPARPPTTEGSGWDGVSGAAPPLSRAALRRGMSALVKKELRENWAYPLMCWLVWAAIAILYTWTAGEQGINILGSVLIQIPTALTASAMGLWIGIGSTIRQRDPDQWALFIHRPVSRSHLFLGRILGGTLLYTLALGLPFALLLVLAATPAGGPFFEWHMTLPTLADFLTGFLCYLVGFLIGDRSAFILGSRVLPVFLAIALLYADFLLPRVSWYLALAALAAGLLLLANWGSTLSRGYRLQRATPLPARWSLRILLTLAFLPLVALASLPFWIILNGHPFNTIGPRAPDHTTTGYGLTPDGALVKRTLTSSNGHLTVTTTDLDGHSIAPPASQTLMQSWSLAPRFSWPTNYRELDRQITTYSVADPSNQPRELWYFVHPAGLAYGYDAKTHAFLGTLGQSGFSPPGSARPTPFQHTEVDSYPFTYPNGIFQVDFDRRTVTTLWQPPSGERLLQIISAPEFLAHSTSRGLQYRFAWQLLITNKSLGIRNTETGALQATLALQDPLTPNTRLDELPDDHGWAIEDTGPGYTVSHPPPFTVESRFPETFARYDAAGRLLWSRHLAVVTTSAGAAPSHDPRLRRLQWDQFQRGLLTSLTLPAAGLDPTVRHILLTSSPNPYFPSLLTPWLNTGLLLGALLCALLTLPLTALYRTPWKPAWILAALLLGPAIPLTLLATTSFPPPHPTPAPKPTPTTILT